MKKILLVCLLLLTSCGSKLKEKYENVSWGIYSEKACVEIYYENKQDNTTKEWTISLDKFSYVKSSYYYNVDNEFYIYTNDRYVLVVYGK